MALCTGPFTVSFAVQMQFNTHCEPDTTVAPLLCVAYELVRPQPPTASTAAQPGGVGPPTLSTVGVASVGRLHGTGVAILYRLPASVALGSHQNRRSRNRAQGIQNLKTLW